MCRRNGREAGAFALDLESPPRSDDASASSAFARAVPGSRPRSAQIGNLRKSFQQRSPIEQTARGNAVRKPEALHLKPGLIGVAVHMKRIERLAQPASVLPRCPAPAQPGA